MLPTSNCSSTHDVKSEVLHVRHIFDVKTAHFHTVKKNKQTNKNNIPYMAAKSSVNQGVSHTGWQ